MTSTPRGRGWLQASLAQSRAEGHPSSKSTVSLRLAQHQQCWPPQAPTSIRPEWQQLLQSKPDSEDLDRGEELSEQLLGTDSFLLEIFRGAGSFEKLVSWKHSFTSVFLPSFGSPFILLHTPSAMNYGYNQFLNYWYSFCQLQMKATAITFEIGQWGVNEAKFVHED